ncbi:MAG: DUF2058 family protein [Myxococcaceae bacterium]
MQNLRDKLLKAGLVSKEQSKEAEEAANRPKAAPRRVESSPRRQQREPRDVPAFDIPKLPPLPGSKAYHRLEALKQRELDDKLRELVLTTEVPLELGLHPFHFVTRKGRLRRLDLSEAQAKALEEGKLAVVERQEPGQIEHALVPPEIAERMMALFPKSVRFLAKAGAAVGFLTEEELRAHQASEASAGPEESTAQAAVPEEEPEAEGQPPAQAEPEAEAKPEALAGGVFIAIKRAPKG